MLAPSRSRETRRGKCLSPHGLAAHRVDAPMQSVLRAPGVTTTVARIVRGLCRSAGGAGRDGMGAGKLQM